MAKQKGREMLVKLAGGTEQSPTYATLCGLTAKTLTINNNEIDVTTADCTTPGGVLWTEAMGGAKRLSISGNGFFEDSATEATLNTLAMSVDPVAVFQVIIPAFGTFQGKFFLGSLEYGGEQEGGVTYALQLASSGAVTFTAAA